MFGPGENDSTCTASLGVHPGEAAGPVSAITVLIAATPDGALNLSYRIHGDFDRVRVPAKAAARISERLWERTCCELFVRAVGVPAYHELNFSPSSEWTAYAFTRYREGRLLADEALDPQITTRHTSGVLELCARIPLARLSRYYEGATLALGISAVIEGSDGTRSHWALVHPADKPDFHHPDAFAFRLNALRH